MCRSGINLEWNAPSELKGEFLEPMELGDNGDLASVKKKKTKNITQLTLLKN